MPLLLEQGEQTYFSCVSVAETVFFIIINIVFVVLLL